MSITQQAIDDTMSGRRKVAQTVMNSYAKARDGFYKHIRRGAVNWAAVDFQRDQGYVAVSMDENRLFRTKIGLPITLGIEVFTMMPQEEKDIDDGMMDKLFEDLLDVVMVLDQAVDAQGNAVVTKIDYGIANAVEASDADKGVQGLIATIPIET